MQSGTMEMNQSAQPIQLMPTSFSHQSANFMSSHPENAVQSSASTSGDVSNNADISAGPPECHYNEAFPALGISGSINSSSSAHSSLLTKSGHGAGPIGSSLPATSYLQNGGSGGGVTQKKKPRRPTVDMLGHHLDALARTTADLKGGSSSSASNMTAASGKNTGPGKFGGGAPGTSGNSTAAGKSAANANGNTDRITLSVHVPYEESKIANLPDGHKLKSQIYTNIRNIATRNEVEIELNCNSKDGSVSVFISGRRAKVEEAKCLISKELHKQAQITIIVPKEYHRFILGRAGAKLKQIEKKSATTIRVTGSNDPSDQVVISGSREGIVQARTMIEAIVEEQSRLANEKIIIPHIYHPFIVGPANENLTRLRETCVGARIVVPLPNARLDEITVSGERDAVRRAIQLIQAIYDEKRTSTREVMLQIEPTQQRYISGIKPGSGITEILRDYRVSVEMPIDKNSKEVRLRGHPDDLTKALPVVLSKATSMTSELIEAPVWLHRFIIGKQGAEINRITLGMDKLQVDFLDSNQIKLEGPSHDVHAVKSELMKRIADLKSTIAMQSVKVDPQFHRHIIGRSGSNILRLQKDHSVQIRMPPETMLPGSEGVNWTIHIDGDPAGVKKCCKEIEEMILKLENEKSKDLILDHRFHNQLIGANGSHIKELRKQFPDVVIVFPPENPGSKPSSISPTGSGSSNAGTNTGSSAGVDIVQVRGPRQQVEQVSQSLQKSMQQILEQNYCEEVRIFKQFHRNIIGKGGAIIRQIRNETDTRIEMPDEQSETDIIRITGRKENVAKAARRIEEIQNEVARIRQVEIIIPQRIHSTLLGQRGKLIKAIQQECGDVMIRFPEPPSKSSGSSGAASDKVIIKGLDADVDKAKIKLETLAEKHAQLAFQEIVRAKPEYHKFLIGRRGANMADFKKKNPEVHLVFPDHEDQDREMIQVVGPKEKVQKAKSDLEELIRQMEDETEQIIDVDPRWHSHFFARKQALLDEINRDFGGVRVFFPRLANRGVQQPDQKQTDPNSVRIVGPRSCVPLAITRIEAIVEDLSLQTSLTMSIPSNLHRQLLAPTSLEAIREIESDFKVKIKFPPRQPIKLQQQQGPQTVNGLAGAEKTTQNGHDSEVGQEVEDQDNQLEKPNLESANIESTPETGTSEEKDDKESMDPADTVTISGRIENCEMARDCLTKLIPISVDVELASEFHGEFIGNNAANLNEFSKQNNVKITVPPANKNANHVTFRGTPDHINQAKKALQDLIVKYEDDKADRLARNFELQVSVPHKYHRQIIGRGGSDIKVFRDKFDVKITVPSADQRSDSITLRGYEAKTREAEQELLKMVAKLDAYVTEDLHIPVEAQPVLIGKGGVGLRRLRDKFPDVDIVFPMRDQEGEAACLVQVTGESDQVDKCCDALVTRANEIMDEVEEREQMRSLKEAAAMAHKDPSEKLEIFQGNRSAVETTKSGSVLFVSGGSGSPGVAANQSSGTGNKRGNRHNKRGPPRAGNTGSGSEGFVVAGAPWDSSSVLDFPTIGSNNQPGDLAATPLIQDGANKNGVWRQ